VIQAVQDYRCEGFINTELEQRLALFYPPYGQLLLLRLSSFDAEPVEKAAMVLADFLRDYFGEPALEQTSDLNPDSPMVEVLGPAPASIFRVARRYRWQILLKRPLLIDAGQTITDATPGVTPIPLPLKHLRQLCPDKVRLSLDIDPLNLM
jgi:primosomal protein N' (replication factor Y) (superfamily II helicase)